MATLPFVAMWGMYGTKNYQAFGASLAIIALFTAVARSMDVVSDPLVSYWSDSARCDRMPAWLRGRRKPFMFFGCFFYSAFLWLLLNPPYVSSDLLALWFGVFYTLYFLANTVTCIPYDALAPELSEDSAERTGLFFVSNLFDGVGTLIALGLPIALTAFASTKWKKRNEPICKTDLERASECLSGRTCSNFFGEGYSGAFIPNASLTALFADLAGDTRTTEDPARDCVTWLRTRALNDSVLVPSATAEQNDGFCLCVSTCADACEVANKRTGFMLVGTIFAIWFVVTMVTAVCRVPERQVARVRSLPIVPSMRNALKNRPFRILLPAWLCDAFVTAILQSLVPYFVEGVVAPAYQTMEHNDRDCFKSSPSYVKDGRHWAGDAGRQDSPTYDTWCDTDNVIAVCGLLALVTAILVLPVWKILAHKLGKVRTWLLWTLTMAATNLLFIFVPKGNVHALWAVSALNGAPLGAKFLADSILADIIDYDEFCTGTRSEATYFMFKSFLPKLVQIPASAIPLALLGTVNYIPPVGGRVQDQPTSVSVYMRCVVGMGFVVSVAAYLIKRQYPLQDDRVAALARGLQLQKQGKWAPDPLSNMHWKPMVFASGEEEEATWLLDHFESFSAERIRQTFPGSSPLEDNWAQERLSKVSMATSRAMHLQMVAATAFLVITGVCAASTLPLLWSEKFQFVPTLFVVFVGVGISSTVFSVLRKRAADRLSWQVGKHGQILVHTLQRRFEHQAQLDLATDATSGEPVPGTPEPAAPVSREAAEAGAAAVGPRVAAEEDSEDGASGLPEFPSMGGAGTGLAPGPTPAPPDTRAEEAEQEPSRQLESARAESADSQSRDMA